MSSPLTIISNRWKLWHALLQLLLRFALRIRDSRPADFSIIPQVDATDIYLHRWMLCDNRFFSWYIHEFLRSDSDPYPHDHSMGFITVLLRNSYVEERIAAGGCISRIRYSAGHALFRPAKTAHRVLIEDRSQPCITMVFAGFRWREWGFHHPTLGWMHNTQYFRWLRKHKAPP